MRKGNTLFLSLLVAAALALCAGTVRASTRHSGKAPKAAAKTRSNIAKVRAVRARAAAANQSTAPRKAGSSKTASGKSAAANAKAPSSSASAKSKPRSSTRSRRGRYTRRRRDRGQKVPAADRISEIQTALGKDGSFNATPNGKWDDSTVAAMKKFQAAHGLNPSGKLDAITLEKLGLGSQTAGVAAPAPIINSSSSNAPSAGPVTATSASAQTARPD